jgi:hypothetical protein
VQDSVHNPNAVGYNRFSGVGVLASTVKGFASTVMHHFETEGKPVTEITSLAKLFGTFNAELALTFCRAVFDGEDTALIDIVFGEGRPYMARFLSRCDHEHGFWHDNENAWRELDAAVTERYSPYAPITRDVQGAQTTSIGLGKDKYDGSLVETEAPVTETVHGKAPITKDIRGPLTVIIGIGNDESGDAEEQRDAPVAMSLGEKAGIGLQSKAGAVLEFAKAVSVQTDDAFSIKAGKKVRVENTTQSLGAILSDFIQAVHDAITLGSPTSQAMNPATKIALQALKTRAEALMEK